MKKAYWFAVMACVAIAGCGGKAEITSDCSLKEGGDVQCTFKNKGNDKGSLCEHFILAKKPQLLAKEQDAKNRYNENWQRILEMIATQAKTAKINAAKSAKEEVKTKGITLDKYIEEQRAALASLAAGDNSYISSGEVCSGLVDAGGTREVKGMVAFMGKPPHELCAIAKEGSWADGCDFTPITNSELDKSIKKAIEATTDK